MSVAERYERLPTSAKLFLITSAVLLPIGLVLTWLGATGMQQAQQALRGRAVDQARLTARVVESLLARNALALRVAANGALSGPGDPCTRARRSLSIAPAVAEHFQIDSVEGAKLCSVGRTTDTGKLPLVAPGAIVVAISPDSAAVAIRMGVVNGMATDVIPGSDIRTAAIEGGGKVEFLSLRDRNREMRVIEPTDRRVPLTYTDLRIGRGFLTARVGTFVPELGQRDRIMLLLPVLMWVAAAFLGLFVVSRFLIRPLRRLETAIREYQPGESELDLPVKLGPAMEIQQLRDAFERAITRVDESERQMGDALEGQRRLVREVHHRVKNNLQVVASLLSIHGRSAETLEARSAYAGIGRRVGALSVVHRNHYAEMEESRGIALRPLLTELAAELRASAPEDARGLVIELEVEAMSTTQDVAVAIAFLITEIVEYAMLFSPKDPVEIVLRRSSELTGRLTLNSKILVPDDREQPDKIQFERIVTGLAKQLRSTLDRKLGRYSIELPVFPVE